MNEEKIAVAEEILERLGWIRRGCDQWEDPRTGLKYGVVSAIEIINQEIED